jgi:hypothetical protein
MTVPNAPSPANDDGVRYEYIDDLDVLVYVEGQGDTTAGLPHPAVQKILNRDRDKIAQLVAWAKRQQEELDARQRQPPQPEESDSEQH